MEPCYPPFDIEDWRAIPVIEERVATLDDVNYCNAVFAAGQGQSEVVATPGLPALAVVKNANGSKTKVVIVQIEKQIGGGMTVVGYVLPEGGNGMGTLSDFDIVEYSR
ncbi:hypothetical protein [Tabrizicola sp.]|jgi:hypothetical protein|uniref:hypothetical protein n=1 Tax=Tabrizicola sp. TaxID=2005166 RepID=UPI0035B253D2